MLHLVQIPARTDNYVWLVVNDARAFVVDPSDAEPVLAVLARMPDVRLTHVVSTHHHGDHTGGNEGLADATGCSVVGVRRDAARIPALTRSVDIGATIEAAGVALRVLDVKAHTTGHVAYAMDRSFDRVTQQAHGDAPIDAPALTGRPALFVGDALFLAGCGRLFEGTPADLHAAMSMLTRQDPRALVCCGHEYTRANLAFAQHVLPNDAAIRARAEALVVPSVPGLLSDEHATNPFLLALNAARRAEMSAVVQAPVDDAVAFLGAVRAAKDAF